jgi:hypothetical protein
MTWLIQRSRAVSRSSRAGSAPAATSIDRTWTSVRPCGSASMASWVTAPRAATSCRVRRTPGPFSQSSMRSGRSTRTRASRSRSSSGAAVPPAGVKACLSLRSRQQRVHSAVDSCQVCRQDAQRCQKAGSGLRQRAQSGRLGVPPFSGAPVPQREQVAQRLRHRSHTGVPVAREMPIRPPSASPQMLQGRPGPGRQLWQTGPASVTAATRRLFPHFAQAFQLRGSRCQQLTQTGCPPSLRRPGAGLSRTGRRALPGPSSPHRWAGRDRPRDSCQRRMTRPSRPRRNPWRHSLPVPRKHVGWFSVGRIPDPRRNAHGSVSQCRYLPTAGISFIAKYAGPRAKSARPWLVTAQSARHNQVPALLWTLSRDGRASPKW